MLEDAGIDLVRHAKDGINIDSFHKLFKSSNLIRNKDKRVVTWVAFNARYDFGYLLNLFDRAPLPVNETCFI